MVREVITLSVGQCGIQLGHSVWEQYCAEHSIDENGKREKDGDDPSFLTFFEESKSAEYTARSLMIDTEPMCIDNVKNGKHSKLFHPEFLLSGKEDAEGNWARGYYNISKKMMDEITQRIRKVAEKCHKLQGFIMNHSVGGGTGSGLGSLISQRIAIDYRKKTQFGFDVYPSPTNSTCVVEPYNSLLTTYWSLEHGELSVVYDNEAIYEMCQKHLDVKRPSYDNMNRLITKNISAITSSLRFEDSINFCVNMHETKDYLVPFPRLHFLTASMSPIVSNKSESIYESIDSSPLIKRLIVPRSVNEEIAAYAAQNVQDMTENCLLSKNFFTKFDDFNAEEDKCMSLAVFYRGDIKTKEAHNVVRQMKVQRKVTFVDWGPAGYKVFLNKEPAKCLPDDDFAYSERSVAMLANNPVISQFFSERISKKYDLMYSERAYVHWYIEEGMEEGEFVEAREDLGFLEKDYLDVLYEPGTDEDDDEWDD